MLYHSVTPCRLILYLALSCFYFFWIVAGKLKNSCCYAAHRDGKVLFMSWEDILIVWFFPSSVDNLYMSVVNFHCHPFSHSPYLGNAVPEVPRGTFFVMNLNCLCLPALSKKSHVSLFPDPWKAEDLIWAVRAVHC